ncbi:MAG: DUF483 domain-containing protein [Kofleriaceae bacterium]|nr:DUF483 domain-containing protein [Kofleriaceae bacterium]
MARRAGTADAGRRGAGRRPGRRGGALGGRTPRAAARAWRWPRPRSRAGDDATAELAALGLRRQGAARGAGPDVAAVEIALPDAPLELWSFRAGAKPVVFLTVDAEREAAVRAAFGGAHVERRERRVEIATQDRWIDDRGRGRPVVELYVARDPVLARRAAALQADADPSHHLRELGDLLGYPTCCVDAFARQADRAHNTLNRYLAASRTAPGDAPWPWPLNELHVRLIPFYPCSYRCPAALRFAVATVAALDDAHPGAAAALRAALARPVVYLDHDRQLWLTGVATAEGVRYHRVARVGASPGLRALAADLAAGDTLAATDAVLDVRRAGQAVATWRRAEPGLGFVAPFGGYDDAAGSDGTGTNSSQP